MRRNPTMYQTLRFWRNKADRGSFNTEHYMRVLEHKIMNQVDDTVNDTVEE